MQGMWVSSLVGEDATSREAKALSHDYWACALRARKPPTTEARAPRACAQQQEERLSESLVLEKTLESPLDCKEIQPVHPKGDQSWVFIGRTDVEAEAPIFWPPDAKSWLIGKDPDAGKDWRQEEKGVTEDEMAGWHHQLDDMSLSKLRELVMDREALRAAVHGVTKSWTWLGDWITTTTRRS